MHELSLARPLAQEIEEKCGGRTPSKIIIAVGEASGIDSAFLRHSFEDHIFPEKKWQSASLVFEKEAPTLICLKCGKILEEATQFACPDCGNIDIGINSGNRVYVKEVICK
ncbi:hydrogenase maturation nickel metallochaperone HypA [bacterium]|nr:hydrogenase maturation nickel metallochaperone HypA [Candidatus Omnitrophota bacterium]MBU2527816.1 hydrogenase maturation nickel metallochaperone HypA [bacterium]MBU3930731.1 hydrogenase maturation nickel metallochaperone HypA [bacterium]MBU4122053.1 hydrogenase maturation nickel metallochaperone HypA [bacterium]